MTKNRFSSLDREVGELKASVTNLTKNTSKEFIKLDKLITALSKDVHNLTLQSHQHKFSIKFLVACSAVFTGVLAFGYKAVELFKKLVTTLLS